MALRQKKGSGLVKLKDTRSSNDGTTVTTIETWTGPYDQLKTKQDSVLLKVKATQLAPTTAGHGILTITREVDLSSSATSAVPGTEVIEVIWQELRRPIETNPYYKDLTKQEILDVKKAVENGEPVPSEGAAVLHLWEALCEGNTEWSTGVPVVRRTTTSRTGKEAKGGAWFRDDPPEDVEGEWEFLKTANETRKEGRSYTQVEEWTGAEKWDENLYPPAGGGGA
jgi:hypothetical protein